MEYRKYIIATLLGITPLIVLLAIFGKNEKIEWALLLATAASLLMLVGYIIFDKRRKRRRRGQPAERGAVKNASGPMKRASSKAANVSRT